MTRPTIPPDLAEAIPAVLARDRHDTATNPFAISLLTATRGSASKRLVPDAHGRPIRDPEHHLGISAGRVEHVKLAGLAGLRDLLARVQHNQALVHGIPNESTPGDVYTLSVAERYTGAPGTIARTLDCFAYPTWVRLIMVDHDVEPEATHRLTGAQDLMDRLTAIWPAFGKVGWLATVSTSSAIRDKKTQAWLRPPTGMHVYLLVTGDVARWRELAKVRLWLSGYGYCKFASPNRHTGVCNILERCLIDLTVFSPERLDYVAGAIIPKGAPFIQDRPAPELHPGTVFDLDSLPDVTDAERTQYTALVAEARARVEPEQRRRIRAHITSGPLALPEAAIEQELQTRMDQAERGELDASQPLYFDNSTTCTAGTLSKAQDGKRLRDPQEPDYGPSQAVFHWRGGDWRIVSWAHGIKRVYQLVPADPSPSPPEDGDMDDLLERVEAAAEPTQERKSQATMLVELAAGLELFHAPGVDGDAYAIIPVEQHREIWPLKAKGFRAWWAHRFYGAHGKNPSVQAVLDGLLSLTGQALFGGPAYSVYTRLAAHDGAIYLDLADDAWQAVEITATSWRVVADPPVKFRRARGMRSLPHPVAGGRLDPLRKLVNVASDDDWMLLVAWLVAALRPTGPYPMLVLHGEQGNAKSTTARILRALVDPSTALLRAEPRDARDLMIAGTNGWVIALDNISRVQPWLSDALCRLATGGGFSTRELYSDAEEMLFDAQRPVILNGIEELATRGDLLDRAIILYLPRIPEAQRRSEADVWRDFERERPMILGALLDAVSAALAKVATVTLARLPRMADFALWVTAAEGSLGWKPGAFLDAYMGNRAAANELALDAAPIVPALRDLLAAKDGAWQGTATDLLRDLDEHTPERTRKTQGWPTNGRALSNALRRVAPNLRAAGVDVTFHPGRTKGRVITMCSVPTEHGRIFASSASSASSNSNNPFVNAELSEDAEDAKPSKDANPSAQDARRTQTPLPAKPRPASRRTQQDAQDAEKPISSDRDREEVRQWTA